MITIPDVNHREFSEFPELVDDSEFQRKDEIFSKSLPRAITIITNAPIIKENIVKIYGIQDSRIILVNHQPSKVIESFIKPEVNTQGKARREFSLPKDYIFYPAMYLPHKNHKTIINTIALLKEKYNKSFNVVFCGNDTGYLDNLKIHASLKKVDNQIRFLNFVNDEFLPYLYLDASLVLMLPIIGPTMIPPWEAFKMRVPVLYSSIKGIKEVLNDCVVYLDPFDKEKIAKKIIEIYEDKNLRNELISKGYKKYTDVKENKEFEKIFKEIDNYFKIKTLWEK